MTSFITHRILNFTRKEVWFFNGETVEPASYIVFSAAQKVISPDHRFLEKFLTTTIQLSKSEEELFNAIHSTYRYDIRQAEKNGIEQKVILHPSEQECREMVNSYNLFAKEKGLKPMRLNKIRAIQRSGCLVISSSILADKAIGHHIYIHDKNTIALSQSFHHVDFTDEKIKGEANKFLHWKDMLHFKELGFKKYDFGGLNEKKFPGIAKFKLNFGGVTEENYRFIQSSKLVFRIAKLLKNCAKKNGS